MNVHEFQRRWRDPPPHVTERQAAQSHFNDLCALFGVPAPNDAPSSDYAFERGVVKLTGGKGFADVWRRGWWAWEYKRPGEELDRAYQQLKLYANGQPTPLLRHYAAGMTAPQPRRGYPPNKRGSTLLPSCVSYVAHNRL